MPQPKKSLYARIKAATVDPLRNPPPRVNVLRLSGVIADTNSPLRGGISLNSLAGPIEQAFKGRNLKAVALAINSPGGSPVQSALIARRLREKAAEAEVPVIAFCEDVAASGGYWLACAADEIYAEDNSIVGSIGVISASFGFQEAIAKLGVERRLYTAGEKKSLLDPFQEADPKDVARLKAIQKEMHESFKTLVRERRGERLTGAEKTLFSGEFWTGRKALELGLVDGLADLRSELRRRFGEELILRKVERKKGLIPKRLGMETGFGFPEPESWGAGLLAAAEQRALWGRFGL
ncbi:MAG: S49 family peptidase [Rhodovibrionaceae bacterium]